MDNKETPPAPLRKIAPEPPQLLYTVEQVADILTIGRSKTYELVMSGDIASVTIGRLRRVPAASVVAYVHALSAAQDAGGS